MNANGVLSASHGEVFSSEGFPDVRVYLFPYHKVSSCSLPGFTQTYTSGLHDISPSWSRLGDHNQERARYHCC